MEMPPVMVWRALFRHRLSLYVWAALPSAAPPCGEPADASAALGGEVPPSARRARAEGAGGARGERLRAGPASVEQRFRKLDAKMQGPQIALVVCRGKRSASTISIEPMRTAPVSVTSAPSTATLYETAEPRRSLTAPQSSRPLNCASTLRPGCTSSVS